MVKKVFVKIGDYGFNCVTGRGAPDPAPMRKRERSERVLSEAPQIERFAKRFHAKAQG